MRMTTALAIQTLKVATNRTQLVVTSVFRNKGASIRIVYSKWRGTMSPHISMTLPIMPISKRFRMMNLKQWFSPMHYKSSQKKTFIMLCWNGSRVNWRAGRQSCIIFWNMFAFHWRRLNSYLMSLNLSHLLNRTGKGSNLAERHFKLRQPLSDCPSKISKMFIQLAPSQAGKNGVKITPRFGALPILSELFSISWMEPSRGTNAYCFQRLQQADNRGPTVSYVNWPTTIVTVATNSTAQVECQKATTGELSLLNNN